MYSLHKPHTNAFSSPLLFPSPPLLFRSNLYFDLSISNCQLFIISPQSQPSPYNLCSALCTPVRTNTFTFCPHRVTLLWLLLLNCCNIHSRIKLHRIFKFFSLCHCRPFILPFTVTTNFYTSHH